MSSEYNLILNLVQFDVSNRSLSPIIFVQHHCILRKFFKEFDQVGDCHILNLIGGFKFGIEGNAQIIGHLSGSDSGSA